LEIRTITDAERRICAQQNYGVCGCLAPGGPSIFPSSVIRTSCGEIIAGSPIDRSPLAVVKRGESEWAANGRYWSFPEASWYAGRWTAGGYDAGAGTTSRPGAALDSRSGAGSICRPGMCASSCCCHESRSNWYGEWRAISTTCCPDSMSSRPLVGIRSQRPSSGQELTYTLALEAAVRAPPTIRVHENGICCFTTEGQALGAANSRNHHLHLHHLQPNLCQRRALAWSFLPV